MKLQGKHIPKYTNDDGWTDAVEVHGAYSVRVLVERDGDMGAPWKEDDGHGPVSDWRSMESKAPGERVLHQDRSQARFYDFAAAVKIAKRDGWGYKGQYDFSGKKPVLTAEARMLTPGARAARAAEEDFDRMADWCNDRWYWVTVGVEVSRDGAVIEMDYCGGIESDGDYWREHAAENAQSIIEQDIKKRKDAATAARKETRERRYWEARDVQTKGTK